MSAIKTGSRRDRELEGRAGCLVALLGPILFLPFAAWAGFVVSVLWGWFVVPLGVASIGVWQAAGIVVLVSFLVFDGTIPRDNEKTTVEKFVFVVLNGLILPAMVLGAGGLYHLLAS